jgi:Kef-type K+ transport system membrane component KefB
MVALIPDPLTRLLAQIAAIVTVSFLLHRITRRLGQPKVIAEVSAGIVLGPSLLGWLAPELSAALFPPESLGPLQLVSQLGLVLFMFRVGLELDPARLRERARPLVVISQVSIAVPFVLGAGLAVLLHPILAEPGVSLLPFALFLGVALSVTAFPVLARILAEHRMLQTKVGSLAIACAAVGDVMAWCLLAFVRGREQVPPGR